MSTPVLQKKRQRVQVTPSPKETADPGVSPALSDASPCELAAPRRIPNGRTWRGCCRRSPEPVVQSQWSRARGAEPGSAAASPRGPGCNSSPSKASVSSPGKWESEHLSFLYMGLNQMALKGPFRFPRPGSSEAKLERRATQGCA